MKNSKLFRLPGIGRLGVVYEPSGAGTAVAAMKLQTNLTVEVIRDGEAVQAKYLMGRFSRFMNNIRGAATAINLGSGLVTHAGVRLLSQDTAVVSGTAALAAFANHGIGTGTNSATVNDTALQTAVGTTATVGTNTNADASPNATVTSIATVTFSGAAAVTEWGLFNNATLSGATMFDRKVFPDINVISGDSIKFTYVLTLNSGG